MKETENIKDCDVYQYLLITILISFLFFSCNNGKKKDSKNRDDIGYILKCPSKPKGLVVLFPMYGMTISETDFQTRIDEKFYEENFASLIINYKKDFFLDKKDFNLLYKLVNKIIINNNIPLDKIIIGGFSTGGNIALCYSIWVNKLNLLNKPMGIFVGDSPVDLPLFYKQKMSILNNSDKYDENVINTSKYLIQILDNSIGNPESDSDAYSKFSPYNHNDIENSNIKYLLDYPICFYSEPALEWYKKNIGFDYDDLNSFSIDSFQNELKKRSLRKIEFIKTLNKGYVNGKKIPHSWSIINENHLFNWMITNQY